MQTSFYETKEGQKVYFNYCGQHQFEVFTWIGSGYLFQGLFYDKKINGRSRESTMWKSYQRKAGV